MSKNKRNRIKLTEEDLRNFVSYSVARLLREAYDFPGKEIMLSNGESDGFERSEYGSSDVEIKFTDWMNEAYLDAKRLILKVNEENGGKFSEILSQENSPEDSFYECIAGLPEDAFIVCLDFTYEQGMKGDGYLQPDDEDSLTINKRELKQPNANNAVQTIQDPMVKELVVAVINEWVDWVDEDYIKEHVMDNSLFEERNLGVTFHSNGEDTYEPENPYGDMTWDEYVKAKAAEHENEKKSSEAPSDGKNLGVTFHSNGEDHEEKTPEEIEDEKHMFDDNYWAGKMSLSREDLAEMIRKSVTKILKEEIDWRKFGRDHDKWLMNNPYDKENVWTKEEFYDTKDEIEEKDFLKWLQEFDPEVFEVVSRSVGNGISAVDAALENGIGWDEIVEDFYGESAKPEKKPYKPSKPIVGPGGNSRYKA